jgi:3-oxoacyl-[acyl-carrier protein] reductase
MDLGLTSKVALVLGGAGGLGSAIGAALAREGARVALADRNAARLESVAATLREDGADVLTLPWDLADLSQVEDNIRQIEHVWGPVQALVNNTGGPPPSPISHLGEDVWVNGFRSMVLPVITITDRVLPKMRANKWGRIITSASSGVIAPIPNLGVSNALRSTLVGWSKTLAAEEAAHGITVNVIVPGRVATDRIRFLDEQRAQREDITVEAVRASSTATIPAGRYGDPSEYGGTVAFLASQAASYVTGSIVRVDGGYIPSI